MTNQQTIFEEVLVATGGNPTMRQAIGLYETVGMPARNLSARTRAE